MESKWLQNYNNRWSAGIKEMKRKTIRKRKKLSWKKTIAICRGRR